MLVKRISQQRVTLFGVMLLALSELVFADVADENSESLKPWLNRVSVMIGKSKYIFCLILYFNFLSGIIIPCIYILDIAIPSKSIQQTILVVGKQKYWISLVGHQSSADQVCRQAFDGRR